LKIVLNITVPFRGWQEKIAFVKAKETRTTARAKPLDPASSSKIAGYIIFCFTLNYFRFLSFLFGFINVTNTEINNNSRGNINVILAISLEEVLSKTPHPKINEVK